MIVHYLIDGYNLLFRLLHKGEEVKKAREAMIHQLALKVSFTQLKASLIFDSKYQKGEMSFKQEGVLHIVFTDEGETADDWILDAVKHHSEKGFLTVVTTDKRLASQVRIKGSQTLSCEDFMGYLNKKVRQQNKLLRVEKIQKQLEALHPPKEFKKPIYVKKPIVKESQVYYEEVFEKKYKENPENQKAEAKLKALEKAKEEALVKKLAKVSHREKSVRERLDGESDMDRWTRMFGA